MDLLRVEQVEDARDKVAALFRSLPLAFETVSLLQAGGRVTAQDVFSDCNIPAFDRSTVDGYAVQSKDTAGAGESIPAFFRQIGKIEMGTVADLSLRTGECAYVPTGGMMPENADAVMMVELCEEFSDGQIAMSKPASPGENVIRFGADAKIGKLLVPKGRRLRPQDIGALAAAGIENPVVVKQPRITVISTGDEIISPSALPKPGQIRDINTYALAAMAQMHGFSVVGTHVIPDNAEELLSAVKAAMQTGELVVVSGGSSRGEKDATLQVFEAAAKPGVFMHGLAMKPGKPTILAFDEASGTLLVGLPGHPVAALMVFERIILEAWQKRTGAVGRLQIPAVLSGNLPGAPGRETCVPVKLIQNKDGTAVATAVFGESGLITTLTESDGYIVIERNTEGLKSGESVFVHLF